MAVRRRKNNGANIVWSRAESEESTDIVSFSDKVKERCCALWVLYWAGNFHNSTSQKIMPAPYDGNQMALGSGHLDGCVQMGSVR